MAKYFLKNTENFGVNLLKLNLHCRKQHLFLSIGNLIYTFLHYATELYY